MRCPNCGGASIFTGFLRVRDRCVSCGEDLSHHRADDAPAWMTIMVVGHTLAPLLLIVWAWEAPMWLHWTLWPTLALGLSLWLLPRMKALVVALQWSRRMGGFGAV